MRGSSSSPGGRAGWAAVWGVLMGLLVPRTVLAQETGVVQGTVTQAEDGSALRGVLVSVEGTGSSAVTDRDGRYTLSRVPAGSQTVVIRWLGYRPQQLVVTVPAGGTVTADVALESQPIALSEIVVEGVSRAPERVVEAPAAVAVVDPQVQQSLAPTGQAPRAVSYLPGADVVQSGVNDFNVNARGFNTTLNRRVLVLQDGRDLAIAFLGSQEWNALSTSLDDLGRIEFVRGPGSALYGANAFSGVLNITTPTAREIAGTKVSVAGGELSTLKADVRQAGVSGDGRFGYKVNAGYYRSDTWSRSRTNVGDFEDEYTDIADTPPGPAAGIELVPLAGQDKTTPPGVPAEATGDRDAVQNIYGSARFDHYADNGSLFTIEGGAAQVENDVFVTGIGRVQVLKAIRPWARTAWAANNYNLMLWYSGRNSLDPQLSLASGRNLEESSHIVHGEAQYNRTFASGLARVVVGGSARAYLLDTQETLMAARDDDRSDGYYSGYAQVEVDATPQLRLVAAGRVDESDLFEPQFSPKGAIVVTPHPDHAIRLSVNRAFQVPNYSEFYLRVPAGAPTASPATLEQSIEGYYAAVKNALGAAVDPLGLPDDLNWNFAAETPILALGNANLEVERVTGWEVGYKGSLTDRVFVSVDAYFNALSNFVTDLLPGVNQAQYPTFDLAAQDDVPAQLAALDAALAGLGLPADHPLRAPIPLLQGGYDQLAAATGPALTTVDGMRAIVVSYANAGKVDEYGVELGLGVWATDELRFDANYTFFEFNVDEASEIIAGQLVPNTPQHKANLAVSYNGRQGFDFRVAAQLIDGYDWAAGVFEGSVPSSQTIDVSAGYQFNPYIRIHAVATNVFDQERYRIFGGSVIGRRFLAGLTATY